MSAHPSHVFAGTVRCIKCNAGAAGIDALMRCEPVQAAQPEVGCAICEAYEAKRRNESDNLWVAWNERAKKTFNARTE